MNLEIFSPRERKFLEFVIQQHDTQIRKYTEEPYWYHVVEVAELLIGLTNCDILIPIAFGHDLIEDPKTKKAVILEALINAEYPTEQAFIILEGISALTDVYTSENYPQYNRKQRKILEVKRLGNIDPKFKTVKLADMINNTDSIVEHDPGFAKTYLLEKYETLKVMANASDFDLYILACATYLDSVVKLRNPPNYV